MSFEAVLRADFQFKIKRSLFHLVDIRKACCYEASEVREIDRRAAIIASRTFTRITTCDPAVSLQRTSSDHNVKSDTRGLDTWCGRWLVLPGEGRIIPLEDWDGTYCLEGSMCFRP